MVKGVHQSLRAVQEWAADKGQTVVDGWVVGGISKRGWTSLLVGGARCTHCVNIIGVTPSVPVAPDLTDEVHRMW